MNWEARRSGWVRDPLSDDILNDVIERAKALLAARKNERQEKALAVIRQLVKERDLQLEAKKPGRKRGSRPVNGQHGSEANGAGLPLTGRRAPSGWREYRGQPGEKGNGRFRRRPIQRLMMA